MSGRTVQTIDPVKAYADYTRPALDGRVLRLAYQVGLGPAGPCATISRWLLTGEKEPGTQLKEDLPVSLRDNGVICF